MTIGDLYVEKFGLECSSTDVALIPLNIPLGVKCHHAVNECWVFVNALRRQHQAWTPRRIRSILHPILAGLTAHLEDLLAG